MQVYEKSLHRLSGATVSMVRGESADFLLVEGENPGFIVEDRDGAFLAPLVHENAALLRKLFPFTAPKPVLGNDRSVGVGDRLGIAGPGHIRVFGRFDASPVLAQQSVRELTLTNRTFSDVLDAATFAVFREDFTRPFGADGDHLKTDAEVQTALDAGYTMITLDCSEKIRNDVAAMTRAEVDAAYRPDPELEALYCGRTFCVESKRIEFDEETFRRAVLIYQAALGHAAHIYETLIKSSAADFELSIDETMTPTTPAQHYFVASELVRRNVRFATIAPRFCGEFQKGVDYIGDLAQFEAELAVHAAIARHFNYKLSIHSGSDKFSVFALIGKHTRGRFHIKTAGTNWLEAMRVAAAADPALYREVHAFALSAFPQATKYYHVTTNLANIPPLGTLADAELPRLFELNDARQLIHITYGQILGAKDASGAPLFSERLYRLWREHAGLYAERLDAHIGKHLALLYSGTGREA